MGESFAKRKDVMTNREYTAAVERGEYPESPMVPIDPSFENEAGLIKNILLEKFSSVAVISSVAGAIRSNHYHKTDWHYMYVLSGQMHYYYRPVDMVGEPLLKIFQEGDLMFTPPMMVHATFFPVDSCIITFARNIRDHAGHEADLVRFKLIEAYGLIARVVGLDERLGPRGAVGPVGTP